MSVSVRTDFATPQGQVVPANLELKTAVHSLLALGVTKETLSMVLSQRRTDKTSESKEKWQKE